ncbi:hypothetical protein COPRO5265_0301 [Coprothermobacter proteolyticus DSM 5265]|uniref:Uncharacterized protein n=1 Tax=Coprothermobacter proteolyticus (strain ATCC 35245 / DSM 5265 / OCM 4 / BT) TaxID=309798 RepID=B5Y7C1_COPPD|nr:hypothetical protein [Coprothermobacter proteolyticus]ACI16826.1 hypothetical protein COPRO5265_0301 [Coprothermobacter proteolyticus DSM 5265]
MQKSDELELVKKARLLAAELTASYAALRSENVENTSAELEETVRALAERIESYEGQELPKELVDEIVAFVHDLEGLVDLGREVLGFYESLLSPSVQVYGPSGKVNKK